MEPRQLTQNEADVGIEKLRYLINHLPNQPKIVYKVCNYLSSRLRVGENYPANRLYPQAFVSNFLLTLDDIMRRDDGYGKRIDEDLRGHPNTVYESMQSLIPKIAGIVYPSDFADQVELIYNYITQKISSQNKQNTPRNKWEIIMSELLVTE